LKKILKNADRLASTDFPLAANRTQTHVPTLEPRIKNILLSKLKSPFDARIIITLVTAEEL
jgi:hypothetical protein